MLVPFGLLPIATYALAAYALRPAAPVIAPLRLALVRAAVVVGGYAVGLVEALAAFHALTRPAVLIAWSASTLAALAGAAVRRRRDGHLGDPLSRIRTRWTATPRVPRAMVVVLAGLALAELLVAVVSAPNNFDSQTYHLPRIEHWVIQRDLDFYPTAIHRQLDLAPGAEYLLLHLRLLTGGDALYNLSQWGAGIGCALLAARLAAQFGGSPRPQLLAAFIVGTTPIVALESTSTQVDLVVAAWTASVATLVLDELHRPSPPSSVALLGVAAGLTAVTKVTGLLAVGPLLLIWFVSQLRRDARLIRAMVSGFVVIGLAATMTGPFLHRVRATYGDALGPEYLRGSVSMQRHDPASILVNALRIGHTALDTPVAPVSTLTAHAISYTARHLGVDPDDRMITFWGSRFPTVAWPPNEDKASLPVTGTLVLLGAGFLLARPKRRVGAAQARRVRAYAAVFWLALLLYVSSVKWQPWGNRLILFLLVLGAPLAGLWLDAVFRRARVPAPRPWPRRLASWVLAAGLLISGVAGSAAVSYGWPRRLVGPNSIFTQSRLEARFQWRPQMRSDYARAAAAVRASGARRVGLVQGNDDWEYPWWVLLPDTDIVALRSSVPGIPAAAPSSVDAIVCTTEATVCARFRPPGWRVRAHGGIEYAVAPST